MKKKFLASAILVLSVSVFSKLPEKIPDLNRLYMVKVYVNKVTQDDAVNLLRDFVKAGRPARLMGTSGHKNAIEFIEQKTKEFDPKSSGTFKVEEFTPNIKDAVAFYQKDFEDKVEGKFPKNSPEYKNWLNFTKSVQDTLKMFSSVKGKNLVWEKKGTADKDKKIFVVGANYDTMNIDPKTNQLALKEYSPGADKNGSGVATLLMLIKHLAPIELKHTVRIVFFDYQSLGFLGSEAYVATLKNDKIEAFIDVEMIGNDSKVFDKEDRMGNMSLYFSTPGKPTYTTEEELSARLTKAGKEVTSEVEFKAKPIGFEYSDNIKFWEAGIPSLVFSQNWETDFNSKRYHTKDDFVETINQRTFHKSLQYITGGVLSLALDLTK